MNKPDFSIPTVDLGAARPGPALAEALATIGFVCLVGHDVDQQTLAAMNAAADRFFDLPKAIKDRYVDRDPLANRGYRARGSEALAYSLGQTTPPDLFESFNAGPLRRERWTDLMKPTSWPDQHVPDYKPAAAKTLDAFTELGRRIDHMLGAELGLPDLAKRSTEGPDMLACIDYRPDPDGREPIVDGQLRMGAHTDYTTYTVLAADPVPGLQIIGREGRWVDVIPEAGSLLMNVGDLLAMWTNDHWPSTLHRVIPMADGAAARRRSIAWFHYPDPDVVVEPLPRFVADGYPRYAPVRVDDHVRGKLGSPKTGQKPTSSSTVQDRVV